jgi:hypothetical protein
MTVLGLCKIIDDGLGTWDFGLRKIIDDGLGTLDLGLRTIIAIDTLYSFQRPKT